MKRVTGLRLDVAPEERFATPEKTCAVFVDALRAGDRATVLACFSPRMRYGSSRASGRCRTRR